MLLYTPDIAGDGGVFPYWATGDGEVATIPAMRASRATAKTLLSQPSVKVELTGQAATPLVYDLAVPWKQIPSTAKVVAQPSQLARIDEVFGSHRDGVQSSESRHATTPAGANFGGWLVPTFATPALRTSYLLGNNVKWSTTLVLDNGGDSLGVNSTERAYKAGERLENRWIAPVENSGLPATETFLFGVLRSEGGLSVNLSPFRHGPQEVGDGDYGNSELILERNGEEVAREPATGLWADIPADAADYKLSLDTARELNSWQYSMRVKSVWSFKAKGGDAEVMPLLIADLDVPQADALSQVPAGKPTVITLGLRHQAGSTAAKISRATLQLSYDGEHWSTLPLTKVAEGKYKTTVIHPAAQAGQAPSLRLTAADTKGGTLEQEVTRAYGLK